MEMFLGPIYGGFKLLEKDSVDTLKTVNLRPIKPSWLSPSRTLFVNRMPKAFEDYTNEEILIEAKEKKQGSPNRRDSPDLWFPQPQS